MQTCSATSPLARARAPPAPRPRGLVAALPARRRCRAHRAPAVASMGAFAAGPGGFGEGAQSASWLAGQLLAGGAAVAALLAYERATSSSGSGVDSEVRLCCRARRARSYCPAELPC
jgi:hypothetical protein